MKKESFKRLIYLFGVLTLAMAVFVACDDDDDDVDPILVEDGVYVAGPATGFDELQLESMMRPGREEGAEFATLPRQGMFETFLHLSAGNFHIKEVAGATHTAYGWGAEGAKVMAFDGEGDDIIGDVIYGTYQADGNEFTVQTSGFYHIVFDKQTGKVFYTKIDFWGAIGDATDSGWANDYRMDPVSVSQNEASWQATGVTMRERGGIKFRYNQGWKIADEEVFDFIIFANIGVGDDEDEFIMGGDVFPHPGDEGEYTITLNWDLSDGWSFEYEKTGDVEPLPEFPEELYMIGDGVGGWGWDEVDLPMVPVHSKPHLFWKIVWMEAEGGFKFAPQKEWAGDFGVTGDPDNGIYNIGGDNAPVPGVEGYYMVVVNLHEDHNKIAVVDPLVYLIGDAIDSWDTAAENALFDVDNENEVLTITRELHATDAIRMYAWFDAAEGWFTDWWQSEFMIFDGEIEFRGTGDDQARVAVEDGEYTIELNFRDHTGSIIKN